MPARKQILAEQALTRQTKKLDAVRAVLRTLENIRPKLEENEADSKKLFKILKYVARELDVLGHQCQVIINN